MGELHHPNVVQLKDVFYMPNDSKLYLCFEYCDYDLKKYMKSCQYKLSANCIKSFTYQMLNGLSWCHSHRIFHRDLKPQNVLVDPKRGTLKLADFGLARAFTVPLRTSRRCSNTRRTSVSWPRMPWSTPTLPTSTRRRWAPSRCPSERRRRRTLLPQARRCLGTRFAPRRFS